MNVSPIVRFWIGIIVTFAIGVTQGTLVLTGAVPDQFIKPFTAWCGIVAFIGSAILTTMNGVASTTSSRVAGAASLEGVKRIEVTPEVAAAVTPQTRADTQIVIAQRTTDHVYQNRL